ncbi:ParB N-terminal domain-containing protein [Kribbella soli]|uniref:Uncharacterized protein n=1 Tax=Kribbella soli TaxID=1124743 RepID=A0A4R0HFF1_9ACTN|nr:ParB N-terminal domain-containing protein [Kribbella soli]TCC08384.1 hypothetical protein E0H45_21090 [Kribbella soli]
MEVVLSWWRPRRSGLIPFADALEAVGDEGAMGTYDDEVPLSQVMGSVSRSDDFDDDFRPRRRTDRFQAVLDRFRSGSIPPAVSLVRLGQMYFVVDGHHRVAAARAQGWTHIAAHVRRICSVAYVCSCITVADLPAKAAERRFLEEVPLPEDIRRGLWLDRPADWARLADSALAWEFRQQRDRRGRADVDAHGLASAWWLEEVAPTVSRIRADAPTDLVDVQLYITELARRDGVADLSWPSPHCCPDHTPPP